MANDMNLMLRIRVNADGTAQALNGTQVAVQRIGTEADNASSAINRFSGAIARVGHYGTAMIASLGLGTAVKDMLMLGDKMTLLDSRVKIATISLADYGAANTALTQISIATRSNLEANITMFGRLNKSVESSGGSFKTTLGMITTLNEGLKISGAGTEEAKSVIIQLSQALSSGVLRGDEFNSVMENGSRIVDALATATGKTKGELRAMAEAGQLSSDVVINALHSQAAAIHSDFTAIPLTIGAALENIGTNWARYIQNVNNATGTTSLFASSLDAIATHFTPIIDGLTTLAQVAAAVFAVKMTSSVISYITTLRTARAAATEAAALELAHSAAIRQNLQVNVARAEALVAETVAQVAAGEATTASIMAERALITARLQQVGATIAQAQATIAATSATIQSTSVIYLNRQATEALAISEEKRAAIIAELALLGRQQAAVSAQVSAAQAAQTAAATGLSTAEEALAGASLGVASGFTLASVAMGALNAGIAIFIGWKIADYLNQFVVVQNAGAMAANYLIKTWESLNYVIEKSVLLLKLDFEGARQLRLEHEASMATHNAITASIIANNNAQEKSAVLSGDMAAELTALKSPQEVYNQKIREANEAAKTLDATTGQFLITEEQRLALGVKALGFWQQANAAEQNAKLSNAAKEVEKLQAQYDKLALPPQTYNKKYAQSFEGTPEEKASIESLSNAIAQLTDSKKILATQTNAQESAANKTVQSIAALESSYTSQVDTLLKSIGLPT